MTVPVLLVSHGDLARRLLEAAYAISGVDPESSAVPLRAVCLDWKADRKQAAALIEDAVRRLDREYGTGVLILTEMFGDTPCNIALKAAGATRAAVVTGVNLPMVLSLCCERPDLDLPDLADWIWSNGRRSIQLAASGSARPPK